VERTLRRIDISIGLNTGIMGVGNFGSDGRFGLQWSAITSNSPAVLGV
jgi:hypothetical protein